MAPVGKIRGIMLTKNEADVVGACIEDALRWIDQIIVYDNMSTDETWEIVRELAQRDPRVVAWKQHDQPFRDGLRAEVFRAFREEAVAGDWWCRLDSDEFYVDDPRTFLSRVSSRHHVVWSYHIEYYLSPEEVATLDFTLPFPELRHALRHYRITSSEGRFFRHRKGLIWNITDSWPLHLGIVAPQRIRLQHYKYRSPRQIQQRLDIRRPAKNHGYFGWAHANQERWEEKLVDEGSCHIDDGSGHYEIDEARLPQHLEPNKHRMIKYLMHGLGIWP